jgi:DNA topoisomerase-1
MSQKLVIVESPAKAKTIGKILGADYVVKSSVGHVVDLPVKRFGVDIENGFQPEYVVVKGRKKVVDDLVRTAKGSGDVYLAPDPDREGEAIAWHLQTLLAKADKALCFHRVSYNEITPKAVRAAFDNPRSLDMNRVNAQQARRVVDRIVGYRVSPLLWKRISRGLSAGRVQSVALRLLCEREKTIRNFIPEDYWIFGALARKLIAPVEPFKIRLTRIDGEKAEIKSSEQSEAVLKDLSQRKLRVKKVTVRDVFRNPYPPFITSTLQQAASSVYGMSPSATMSNAQHLYEGIDIAGEVVGLITYMRTDSCTIAAEAIEACRGMIKDKFPPEYLPDKPRLYKSRAGAQGAHEAIRPTDVARTPETLAGTLGPTELKIYELIWKRFVASQMTASKTSQRTVEIDAETETEGRAYTFLASASELVFPGFTTVFGAVAESEKTDKDDEDDEAAKLPPLAEGEPLECLEWLGEQKSTKPPNRYSEAALVRELEQNGVGRPSTYAQILSTLNQRNYASRERRTLFPTELGEKVSDFLVSSLGELFQVGFTAKMEESLDKIEEGELAWEAMVGEFYEKFAVWFEKAKGPPADTAKVLFVLEKLEVIREWAPEVKHGKRTYSDAKFVESIREQLVEGAKPVTERQLTALVRLACRYEDQIDGIRKIIEDAGLSDMAAESDAGSSRPSENTLKKLDLLKEVECQAPAKRGKRTYDDRKFIDSLRRQADSGRSLSVGQRRQVDRLLLKYSSQIQGFDELRKELAIEEPVAGDDAGVIRAMLDSMGGVKDWREPTTRGNRVFDDHAFYESLSQQFRERGSLSPRQVAALKRLSNKYKDQIETEE